ncbi:hypothetical protein [Myxosarcina sp. GI1]|uniref:hypothetical protein n=1 Tax=Myxosarcina sp. GI1 TaxID=1541065 RepID=UPI00068FD05C|nr:hypothetical protein [Myxosarcina sp. GI1]
MAATVGLITDIPTDRLTRDIAAIAEVPSFYGMISNIGILLWCASASICLFVFAVLQKLKIKTIAFKNNFLSFLLFSGLITLMLMFDDLFLLHEDIFPSLNISEMVVYSSYVTVVLLYLLKFRKIIFSTTWGILCLGFLFFAASLTIDFFSISGSRITLLEDGFKLLGIASWFSYFVSLCFETVKNTIDSNLNHYRRR